MYHTNYEDKKINSFLKQQFKNMKNEVNYIKLAKKKKNEKIVDIIKLDISWTYINFFKESWYNNSYIYKKFNKYKKIVEKIDTYWILKLYDSKKKLFIPIEEQVLSFTDKNVVSDNIKYIFEEIFKEDKATILEIYNFILNIFLKQLQFLFLKNWDEAKQFILNTIKYTKEYNKDVSFKNKMFSANFSFFHSYFFNWDFSIYLHLFYLLFNEKINLNKLDIKEKEKLFAIVRGNFELIELFLKWFWKFFKENSESFLKTEETAKFIEWIKNIFWEEYFKWISFNNKVLIEWEILNLSVFLK